jgi:hypothetical protein
VAHVAGTASSRAPALEDFSITALRALAIASSVSPSSAAMRIPPSTSSLYRR